MQMLMLQQKFSKELMKTLKSDFIMHANVIAMIFTLLLQKNAYPYEYKNDWKKSNETLPQEKICFY